MAAKFESISLYRYGLEPPKVTFVQEQRSPRSGIIIILDNGPQLASHWAVIRNGLEQLMLVLPKGTSKMRNQVRN